MSFQRPNRRRAPTMLAALLALPFAGSAHAAIFLVGNSATDCDFNNIASAIAAAASNPGEDVIRVANDRGYLQQALTIGSQDLTIQGGFSTCAAATPPGATPDAGVTTVSGAGGSAAPVFSITGSGVRVFRNLSITGGDVSPTTGSGGGINFRGTGEVILRDSVLQSNSAAFGGGINFSADGGAANLRIEANTQILNNTAVRSGGGVRIEGPARLFMVQDRSVINGNQAFGSPDGGFGGGLLVLAPALADIGSPGLATGTIVANRAVFGAGVAVIADSGGADAAVRIFSIDGNRPARIADNFASTAGGALYARPKASGNPLDTGLAALCLNDVQLDANRAPVGAAAALATNDSGLPFFADLGGTLLWGTIDAGFGDHFDACEFPEPITALGGQPCTQGQACRAVRDNFSATPEGVASNGPIFSLGDDALMAATGVVFGANTGSHVVLANSVDGLELDNSRISDNALTDSVIRFGVNDANRFALTNSTIAGNQMPAGVTHTIRVDSGRLVAFRGNIVWQPGKDVLAYPGSIVNNPDFTADEYVVNSYNGLPDGPFIRSNIAPQFNDPSITDYRLRFASSGVELGRLRNDEPLDLDRRARNQRIWLSPIFTTTGRDIGAYERQPGDPLVVNGAFYSLSQWTVGFAPPPPNPLGVTFTTAINDGPSDGTGAVQVSVPTATVPLDANNQRRINALTQCFLAPKGTYTLGARARSATSSLGLMNADAPILRWRLREGSSACTGPATTEGDAFFAGGTGFQSLLAPVAVVVPEAGGTIEIRLDVRERNPLILDTNTLAMVFDNVTMTYTAPDIPVADVIFTNGFESP